MLKEFREFALRGNVVDMAVGIIIGAAFGAIVQSLVTDVLMPPIGALFNTASLQEYKVMLAPATAGHDAVVLTYGKFIDKIVTFLIVAFAMFLLVKQVNRMKRPAAAEPTTKDCPFCLSVIPIKATKCAQCTSEVG